jgi:hypothetical protein
MAAIFTETFTTPNAFSVTDSTSAATPFLSDGSSDYLGITKGAGTSYFSGTAPLSSAGTDNPPSGVPTYVGFDATAVLVIMDADADAQSGTTYQDPYTFTWSAVDVSGCSGLSFTGKFAASGSGHDYTDYVQVSVAVDGSAPETLLYLRGCAGSSAYNNGLCVSSSADSSSSGGTGATISSSASTLSASIVGTGTSLVLTVVVRTNSGSEDVAMDDLSIVGTCSPASSLPPAAPPSPPLPPRSPSPPSWPMSCPTRAEVRDRVWGHTAIPYTSSSTDVWDVLKLSDRDPANPTRVRLVYSGAAVLPGAPGQEYAAGWSREHLYPQSLGGFHSSSSDVPALDLHGMRPANTTCNSVRSNLLYGVVSQRPISRPDCQLNCAAGVCEPPDREKGRIARAIFYMVTRYDGHNDTRDTPGAASWNNLTVHGVATSEAMLVAWSEAFPPDAFEVQRDTVIASYQGHSNPFVTAPEMARCLFAAAPAVPRPPGSPPPPTVPPVPPVPPAVPPLPASGCPSGPELFFSQVQEATSGNNKYMQIFNPTSASVTLDGYFIGGCSNGCTTPITSASSSDSFEVTFSFPANAIVAAAAVYTLCNSGLTGDTSMCDVSSSHTILSFNGDDFRALCRGSPTSYTIIDQIGLGGADPGSSWPVCGSHSSIDTRNGLLLRATNRCCGLGLLGDAEYASSFVGVCSWATEVCADTQEPPTRMPS